MVRNPAYTRKAPWSERGGPALLETRRLEVRPRGGHARDDAGERRDAGHLPRPGAGAAAPGERHGRCGSTSCRGRACRASGCSTSTKPPLRRREGPPRRQPRGRQGGVPGHRLQGHRPQGLRAPDRGHARRPARCARPIPFDPAKAQGAPRRGGLAAAAPTASAPRAASASRSS